MLAEDNWEQLRDPSKGEGDVLPGGKGKKPSNKPDERDMVVVIMVVMM